MAGLGDIQILSAALLQLQVMCSLHCCQSETQHAQVVSMAGKTLNWKRKLLAETKEKLPRKTLPQQILLLSRSTFNNQLTLTLYIGTTRAGILPCTRLRTMSEHISAASSQTVWTEPTASVPSRAKLSSIAVAQTWTRAKARRNDLCKVWRQRQNSDLWWDLTRTECVYGTYSITIDLTAKRQSLKVMIKKKTKKTILVAVYWSQVFSES